MGKIWQVHAAKNTAVKHTQVGMDDTVEADGIWLTYFTQKTCLFGEQLASK